MFSVNCGPVHPVGTVKRAVNKLELELSVTPLTFFRAVPLVMDMCSTWNGGCAKDAKCVQKGEKVTCTCPKAHKGDGFTCQPIDPCASEDNGGCHEHATCTMTGPVRTNNRL